MLSITGWQDAKFRAEIWVIQLPCKVTLNSELFLLWTNWLCWWPSDSWGTQTDSPRCSTPTLQPNSERQPRIPPLLLRGLREWQLSVGGIHMEPFHQCRPLGPVWLTVARCKSSAHIKSYCCISASEIFHFCKGRLFKKRWNLPDIDSLICFFYEYQLIHLVWGFV